jgi:hypothetical protein
MPASRRFPRERAAAFPELRAVRLTRANSRARLCRRQYGGKALPCRDPSRERAEGIRGTLRDPDGGCSGILCCVSGETGKGCPTEVASGVRPLNCRIPSHHTIWFNVQVFAPTSSNHDLRDDPN